MGYSMDLAVTRAVARPAWAARSRSIASKLNSPSACRELDVEATPGRPPGEPRVDLVGAVDAGHDQPVDAGCGGVGGCCDQSAARGGS